MDASPFCIQLKFFYLQFVFLLMGEQKTKPICQWEGTGSTKHQTELLPPTFSLNPGTRDFRFVFCVDLTLLNAHVELHAPFMWHGHHRAHEYIEA